MRDISSGDIDEIVSYWHDSDGDFLTSIGVNLEKIVSRETTQEIFSRSLPENRNKKDRVTLVFVADDILIGYTNLNFSEHNDEVYAHVHLIKPEYRNKGIVPSLFADVIGVFYRHFNVGQLILQTNTKNKKINSLLINRGLEITKTEYIDKPDGMGSVGEYNFFYVPREKFIIG